MINKGFFSKYREQILYLVFGVLTTVLNFLAFAALFNLANMNYLVANIIAWIVSVFFAFLTNRKLVFQSNKTGSKSISEEAILFVLSRLFSLGAESLILWLGVSILLIDTNIVKITANIVVVVLNYVLSKYLVFKR